MKISIICPIYNAENYIEDLYFNINRQKDVYIEEINFILTESKDNTEDKLKKIGCTYEKINKEKFSHSLVREKAAFNAKGDIIVFITQDIKIEDEYWLYYLTKDIKEKRCEAAFSRQIGYKEHKVERYTREINYPDETRIVSKDDIEKLGLMTFFFSDAASAINRKIFEELNGYDGKNLPTNEDMYIAYKLITKGYKIKYCADSEVIHSHTFTLKQLYKRYYDTGLFFGMNSFLDKYGTTKAGGGLAKYILKRAIQDKNIKVLLNFIPNMAVRYIGMKKGKKDGRKR